jgi:hypothetical protein
MFFIRLVTCTFMDDIIFLNLLTHLLTIFLCCIAWYLRVVWYGNVLIRIGYGELHLTIRTWSEPEMERLIADIVALLDENTHNQLQLKYTVAFSDVFLATNSTTESVTILDNAAQKLAYPIIHNKHPMRWGEDFGHFTQKFPGAFFGIGAGLQHAALHNPDYDYPDELLELGVNMFVGALEQLGMVDDTAPDGAVVSTVATADATATVSAVLQEKVQVK